MGGEIGEALLFFERIIKIGQLLGGIALLTPRFSGYGALLLACVMAGAIIVRIAIIGGNPAATIVLLLVTGFIAWNRLSVRHPAMT